MNTVTQTMLFRQALIKHAEKHGVTAAAIKYRTNRQYVYRWKRRYDGSLQSLADKSHKPHSHPNQHTETEITLIKNMRKRNLETGLVVFWVKLRQRGYTRSITGLWRMLRRLGLKPIKPPNPKYVAKPYEQMNYPCQRVQIDVKFVPSACLVGEAEGRKFYQYTAIDEYSRFRYLEAFEENSSYQPFSLKICLKLLNSRSNVFKQITVKSLPRGSRRNRRSIFLFFRQASKREILSISLYVRSRRVTTVKLNALIARITNIFMPFVSFIHSMTLKSNSL